MMNFEWERGNGRREEAGHGLKRMGEDVLPAADRSAAKMGRVLTESRRGA
jgi:hypothetical protein